MLSGPVELLFFADLMASLTCSVEIWNGSSSTWFGFSFLVLLSMMRLIFRVLCGVEFVNCWLKDLAMLEAVDLSLALNWIVLLG